jgi:hypothetical protein
LGDSKPSKVAVIAVHGVGQCDPGDSAKRVSDLLLGLPENRGVRYEPIAAEAIHIPLHPLTIVEPLLPNRNRLQSAFKFLEERTSLLTLDWKTTKKFKSAGTPGNAQVADDFMRLALQDYRGSQPDNPENVKNADDTTSYITTRLKTARISQEAAKGASIVESEANSGPAHPSGFGSGNAGSPGDSGGNGGANGGSGKGVAGGGGGKAGIDVHVYEMHWADLSRPKSSILSFFMALYQLLFHLASLSRLVISMGELENKVVTEWRALDRAQNYAVRMLTLPIPILNVLMFATLFGLAPRILASDGTAVATAHPLPAAIVALIITLVAYALASPHIATERKSLFWTLLPFLSAIAVAALVYLAANWDPGHIVLSVEGLIVGAAIVYVSVDYYDDVRDGAKEVTIALSVICASIIALCWTCGGATSVQSATLWAMQIELAALRISWIFLCAFALAAGFLGWAACLRIKKLGDSDRHARARAAVRTSRLALALPTMVMLIVTLAFWSALFVKASPPSDTASVGNTLAVRLFGTTVDEIHQEPSWLRSFLLPDRVGLRRYLGPIPAVFTIRTKPVQSSIAVTITATSGQDSQNAVLTVNPANVALNLNPATVKGGEESTATVTLNSRPQGDGTDVIVKSSDSDHAPVPPKIPVAQGLAPAPEETKDLAQVTEDPTAMGPNDFFRGLMVWSATPGFLPALAFMASGFFLLIIWALPSVFAEAKPPIRSSNADSDRMGDWLSRGLDSTRFVTGLIWTGTFIVLSAFAMIYGWAKFPAWLSCAKSSVQYLDYHLITKTAIVLEWIGAVASSVSILAGLAGSGSPILGIILDVDNYLRTSPKDFTPRARIAERYVSLLRYVSEYKDPCVSSDTGYDRVVIVGHSLGALISADLLRFLKSQRDSQTGRFYFSGAQPDLNRPKIQLRLFTMGNPLRQLLNRFFPYLYEWVRLAPDNSLKGNDLKSQHAPHGAPPPGIDPAAMPDPSLLNVELWLNAYRSGDYVGRSLWLNEWYDREVPVRKVPTIPGPVYVAEQTPPGACKEMCIGAGAHQHYWDPSAPDIAKKLDELISE